jgi:hypothetical protein
MMVVYFKLNKFSSGLQYKEKFWAKSVIFTSPRWATMCMKVRDKALAE